jgi:ABC-type Fe3+/spermidine/putrescine transport system ATPase subunit
MNEGRINQVGSPREVYEEPASAYVAGFLGVSNLLDAEAIGCSADGRCRVRVGDFELLASRGHTSARGTVKVVVRPERVRVGAPRETGENRMLGTIERAIYAGAISHLVLNLGSGASIQCMLANDGDDLSFTRGAPVSVHLPCEALRVLRTSTSDTSEGGSREPSATLPARATAD